MAKELIFTYEGKDYTLGYSKNTIREMESRGFTANRIGDVPATVIPDLFAGAFLLHHKFVKPEVIEAIYQRLPNKPALLKALGEMYSEPIEALMAEPENPKENVSWTTNW